MLKHTMGVLSLMTIVFMVISCGSPANVNPEDTSPPNGNPMLDDTIFASTNPDLTGGVLLNAQIKVGEVLTANTSNLGGTGAITYVWMLDDETIPDSTGNSYTVPDDDALVGKFLTVEVTRSGFKGSKVSNASEIIGADVIPVAVTGVTISPDSPGFLKFSGTQQFTATVTYNVGPSDGYVDWSVDGNADSNTKITSSGLLTIGENETKNVTVKAVSLVDTTKSKTVTVTVKNVSGVTVTSDSTTIVKEQGQTAEMTFNAAVAGFSLDSGDKNVTWTVSGNTKAGTGISTAGKLTVASDETAGSLVIKATSVFNPSKYGERTVTLAIKSVSGVVVNPASISVQKGNTQQFTATVNGSNLGVGDKNVTWTVNGIAGTTITSGGLLTVAAGETAASLTVKATSAYDTAKSGTATVTVQDPGNNWVNRVVAAPVSAQLPKGGSIDYKVAVDGSSQSVNWSVSGNNMPGTKINSATGKLTVDPNETATTIFVQVTSNIDSLYGAGCEVRIVDVEPTDKMVYYTLIEPLLGSVTMGASTPFTATIVGQNLTPADLRVEWSIGTKWSDGYALNTTNTVTLAGGKLTSNASFILNSDGYLEGGDTGSSTIIFSVFPFIVSEDPISNDLLQAGSYTPLYLDE